MAEVNPSPQEVASKVPAFREKFQEKNKAKFAKYDQRDIDRFMTDDGYARCFLRTLKARGDITKALDVVHESFKFRKEFGIWDLKEETFPERIQQKRDGIYYKNQDKDGHPILYFNVKENNAQGSEELTWLKKYIAFKFEEHQSKNPEQMVVVLMDMSGSSQGNVSIDIIKYIITCFTTYFPAFIAYCLNYEMPGILSGIWSVVKTFLSGDQNKKLIMIKKKDILNYIPESQLWDHMK